MSVPKMLCGRTDGHQAHDAVGLHEGRCVGLLPLFCCDIDLEALYVYVVSSGMNPLWNRVWECPMCGRQWVEEHDHHADSGMSHDWGSALMVEESESYTEKPSRDTLCALLNEHPLTPVRHREFNCVIGPTEVPS